MTHPKPLKGESLLPCPWCGNAPGIFPRNPALEGDAWAAIKCVDRDCPAELTVTGEGDDHSDSVADAAERWNRRTSAQAASATPAASVEREDSGLAAKRRLQDALKAVREGGRKPNAAQQVEIMTRIALAERAIDALAPTPSARDGYARDAARWRRVRDADDTMVIHGIYGKRRGTDLDYIVDAAIAASALAAPKG